MSEQEEFEKEMENNFKEQFPLFRHIANGWPYAIWAVAAAEIAEVLWMVFG